MAKKNISESVKRFQQIMEYIDPSGSFTVNEDGEDNNGMPTPDGGMDPNAMGDNTMPDGGMDPNAMGGDPNAMGGDPNMMGGDPNAMGGDPNAMGGETPPQGFAPQGQPEPNVPEEEEEEVIDVDELVDTQEKTEHKLDKLATKFDDLLDKIDSFEKRIDDSNERMETLKSEIEKRNPTPVEKLSLRAKDSYPFSVSPEEYWKDKEATSNYSTEDDNNGADDRIYQITKDEIDNFNDYASMEKTFDNFGLKDMFGY